MREIKFRVWDLDSNQFVQGVCIHQDGDVFVGRAHSADKLVIQQFTGLHDKNGREIYEGDIIRAGDTIHEVKWDANDDSYPAFDLDPVLCDEVNSFSWANNDPDAPKLEVIGNIYENPELLKN